MRLSGLAVHLDVVCLFIKLDPAFTIPLPLLENGFDLLAQGYKGLAWQLFPLPFAAIATGCGLLNLGFEQAESFHLFVIIAGGFQLQTPRVQAAQLGSAVHNCRLNDAGQTPLCGLDRPVRT